MSESNSSPEGSSTRRIQLALLLVPVFVVAFFLLFQRGPRAAAPEALDLVRGDGARIITAPAVELKRPSGASVRDSVRAEEPLYPFDPKDALRIRLESSKKFTFDRVWVKTATEPRWVARSLLDSMVLPYLESELPLYISVPGHREYPLNRIRDYALFPVDAYTVLDLSGFGQRLCMNLGFELDFEEAYTVPPFPERFAYRLVGNQLHLARKRNSSRSNPRTRLRSDFELTTSCGWRLDFTWKPMPDSSSWLDVASKIAVPRANPTSVSVRLSAPFEFNSQDFELSYATDDRQRAFKGQAFGDFDVQRYPLKDWGEVRLVRDREPRALSRHGETWTLSDLSVGDRGVIVAGDAAGTSFGRWLGTITPDLSVEIRLERGVFLAGRLVEQETGSVIRGAKVALDYVRDFRARIDSGGPKPQDWGRTIPVPTNSNGRFRVSSTSPPAETYRAPSRPPYEFWAKFSAPFYEPVEIHRTDSERVIDLGEIVLSPKAADISFLMETNVRIPLETLVILKREGLPDPKLCRVSASRYRRGRLDLDVQANSLNTGTIHQVGPDEPALPVERGMILTTGTPILFARSSDSQRLRRVGTRELDIEVTLPSTQDPKFLADLSYDWNGLLIQAASFRAEETGESTLLRRIVPAEAIELFIQSKDGKFERRVTVPRNQKSVALAE